MKYVLSFLFVALSWQLQAQNNKNKKAVIATNIYCSHCQACETCSPLMQKSVLKVKGVKMVNINPANNVIEVVYNENKIDLASIKNAIAAAGYDADEVKADTKAYQSLDGCCKKK